MHYKNNNTGGFTIIETMTAVSIFIIVVTIGIGALLNANSVHNKSQNMRSIMDNMNFIMEDISRNLRTGYNYRCVKDLSDMGSLSIDDPYSDPGCIGVAFEYALGNPTISNDQWVYFIGNYNGQHGIHKSTDGGASFVKLTPNEVTITSDSGFSVSGAESPNIATPNYQQPFVTFRLVGNITYRNFVTPFSLQTSVSQRAFDI